MSEDQKLRTSARKPILGLLPIRALLGAARVFGFGALKYSAGNFHTANLSDGAGQRYISAALRHLAEMQEANGLHSPQSLAALDPESGLPHIDHVLCGLMMLRAIMIKGGALEADPGVGLDPVVACKPVANGDSCGELKGKPHTHSWNVPLSMPAEMECK